MSDREGNAIESLVRGLDIMADPESYGSRGEPRPVGIERVPFRVPDAASATHNRVFGGDHYVFTFGNGYGASVVRHRHSYGFHEGLWELAVLDKDGNLTYGTPITDDVIGRQTEAQIGDLLDRIAALPSAA